MAVTAGIAGRAWWIGGGAAAGVLGACVLALFAASLSAAFEGFGQELFNAAIVLGAVAMLTWHHVWMAARGDGAPRARPGRRNARRRPRREGGREVARRPRRGGRDRRAARGLRGGAVPL